MRIPVLRGLIDRRMLVNFRVDADVLARILPPPFRPQLIAEGVGMAGICLIRLKGIRPRWLPPFLGLGSENAAHRIAVEWDDHGATRSGVYIPRRDSSSLLNWLAGGRLFPGVHHHSRFVITESADEYRLDMSNTDGTHVLVEGHVAGQLPDDSIFSDLSQASEFFARGSLGYSATGRAGAYDGLKLHTLQWEVQPLSISRVESSFFADKALFPPDAVQFDCALLMRHIPHEWHGVDSLTCCVTAGR
jgi:hypothetical protein